ncbi:MAG: FHA domain-containing protein [Acidobacteria bacterium]|nr:FHA domain-containing protein [Acidobacteriota bacterium]
MSNPNPRLVVTDPQGRIEVLIDKPLISLGRRTESDIRVSGVGVSRHHSDIEVVDGACRLHDRESKFGTFVNGVRATDHVLAHGDVILLGESHDTEILFLIRDEDLSRERSAISAATELRHMARLLEGLRALGSGRVLDDVLALVSTRRSTSPTPIVAVAN